MKFLHIPLLSLLAFLFVGTAQAQTLVTTTDGLTAGDYIYITNGTTYANNGVGYYFNGTGGTYVASDYAIPMSCTFIVETANSDDGSFYLKQASSDMYVATATKPDNATIPDLASSAAGAAIFVLESTTTENALRVKTYKNNDGTNETYIRVKANRTADYHNGTAGGTLAYVYKYDDRPSTVSVTYNAYYNNEKRVTETVKYYVGQPFTEVTTLPHFLTVTGYPARAVASTDDNQTYNLTVTTDSYPIKFSSSPNDATWYFLTIGGCKMHDNGTETYMSLDSSTPISMADKGDLWCFVGNPFDGFTIYNGNDNKALACKNSSVWDTKNGNLRTPVLVGTSDESYSNYITVWGLTAKNDGTVPSAGSFYIYYLKESSKPCLGYTNNTNTGNVAKLTFHNNEYKNALLGTSEAVVASTDIAWKLNDGGDGSYYSTLYLPYEAAVPDGVTAYTGTIDEENAKVMMNEIVGGVIPEKTGVLLVGNAASATLTLSSTSATEISGNSLKGTCSELTDQTTTDYLVFGMSDSTLGFYTPSSTTLKANRAYIEVGRSNAQGLSLDFGNGTTGISSATTAKPAETNAPVYDLYGRRVTKAVKGIYIQGGKKILVK